MSYLVFKYLNNKFYKLIKGAISDDLFSFNIAIEDDFEWTIDINKDIWHKSLKFEKLLAWMYEKKQTQCLVCNNTYSLSKRRCCNNDIIIIMKYPNLSNITLKEFKNHFLHGFKCGFSKADFYVHLSYFLEYLEEQEDDISFTTDEKEHWKAFIQKNFELESKYFFRGLQSFDSESFNSLSNHFCPKGKQYTKKSFMCRKYLACLHWNALKMDIEDDWRFILLNSYFEKLNN